MKSFFSIIIFLLGIVNPVFLNGQDFKQELVIKSIYKNALGSRKAYNDLRYLCKNTKGRISGSPQAAEAVEFTYQLMKQMNLDSVWLQPVMVKNWKRGKNEKASIHSSIMGIIEVPVLSLGGSVGTGEKGITAGIVEVKSFEELEALGKKKIKNKIVFFNKAMDPTLSSTFKAYSKTAFQRTRGAAEAAKYGAVAVVVRSLTIVNSDFPHTGIMFYEEGIPEIPAVVISTNGANLLNNWLKKDPGLQFYFENHCELWPEVLSYNVIGEIRGRERPDEIITIGGHLDSWDNSEGAHDDGGGCMQSIDVLRIFNELDIEPKRTVRAVMFMDEEYAQRGGQKYAEEAARKNEKHYFALESDAGVLTPRGFGFSLADEKRLQNLLSLNVYFKPYKTNLFKEGGWGVDIYPLRHICPILIGYIPDDSRYFNYHHSANDTFEKINHREMQMGTAAIASLVYLIDYFDF